MTTPFGTPFPPLGAPGHVTPRSIVSTIIVEPTLGFDVSRSPLNIAQGATPNSNNWIMREGRLEPRPVLSQLTDIAGNPSPTLAVTPLGVTGNTITGGLEVVNVLGTRYIMLSTRNPDSRATVANALFGDLIWMQPSTRSWTERAVYSGPNSSIPTLGVADYYDWTQVFYDQASDNIAVGATTNRQGLYAWVPSARTFSVLTGSPGAKCVCALDNYVLAGNTAEGGVTFIQRVRWSDRGSASSWTGGLSGYEDLLSAKGGINRMLPLESRVIVFFDDETWTGTPIDFPNTFRFAPLDTSLGCPYPWTATVTPRGIMFMARNFQLYLLPKEGGSAVAIGKPVHRSVRNAITQAKQAFGIYDGVRNLYQFYYSSSDSDGVPRHALWLDLDTGAWAPQSFASFAIKWGFGAQLSLSSVPTWDDITTSWDNLNRTWDDMLGTGNESQAIVLATSHGTTYVLRDTATKDDTKDVAQFWESDLLGEEWPGQQKTITRTDIDYTAISASTVSVRALAGAAYSTGTRVRLPATSFVSQIPAYDYAPARYAAIRVESTSQQSVSLHRFHVTMRVGGR